MDNAKGRRHQHHNTAQNGLPRESNNKRDSDQTDHDGKTKPLPSHCFLSKRRQGPVIHCMTMGLLPVHIIQDSAPGPWTGLLVKAELFCLRQRASVFLQAHHKGVRCRRRPIGIIKRIIEKVTNIGGGRTICDIL